MRPTSSEALNQGVVGAGGRSRKSSSAEPTMTSGFASSSSTTGEDQQQQQQQHHSPMHTGSTSMTYFLADEATVNASVVGSASASGTFGVRSLNGALEDAESTRQRKGSFVSTVSTEFSQQSRGDSEDEEDDDDDDEERDDDRALDDRSVASFQSSIHPSSGSTGRTPPEFLSQPLTPILGPTPDPQGTPLRSPSGNSYRSEEDVMSEPMEKKDPGKSPESLLSPDASIAPQLIMPEITIPSRRPFTLRGKNIGRLKVLIAGDSGRIFISYTYVSFVFYCSSWSCLHLFRYWQNILDQVYCAGFRGHCSCRPDIHRRLTIDVSQ